MKIIVFGATGSIGRKIVELALKEGHLVTAFSRQPEKHWPSVEKGPSLIQADVLDAKSVLNAIAGHEAVLCTLGAGAGGMVRAAGTKNIVDAMQQTGVRRLICQTTLGVGDSITNLNFFWKYLMFGLLLRRAFADHVEQEAIVAASALDWTIVRPSAFTNDPSAPDIKYGFGPDEPDLKLKVARIDVAAFMLKQLTMNDFLRKAVGLSR
jgi:uncharacterized protein YbjT (DUF2867 family)